MRTTVPTIMAQLEGSVSPGKGGGLFLNGQVKHQSRHESRRAT